MHKDVTITARIDGELSERLGRLSAMQGRSKSWVDLPGKSGERFSVYAASASKRHGLLYPRAECRLTGL